MREVPLLPASWRLTGSAIGEYLDYLSEPIARGVIDLARGVPDPLLRRASAIKEAYDEVLDDPDIPYLYTPLGGPSSLRDLLRRLISEHAFEVPPGYSVVVTAGTFSAFNTLAKLILTPGDVMMFENPTFTDFLPHAVFYGASTASTPVVGKEPSLETVRPHYGRAAALYTIPTLHNPTGLTFSDGWRSALAEMVKEFGLRVIEDMTYSFIHPSPPKSPVCYIGGEAPYALIGSLSKVIAPGLRIGFAVVPRTWVRAVELAQLHDLSISPINAAVVEKLVRNGVVDKLIAEARRRYTQKVRVALDALSDSMPDWVSWTEPVGGFYIMLYAPGVDMSKLLAEALMKGVAYVPGDAFHIPPRVAGKHTARLSVAVEAPERIVEGIMALASVLKDVRR